jgi:hypothetical protein
MRGSCPWKRVFVIVVLSVLGHVVVCGGSAHAQVNCALPV